MENVSMKSQRLTDIPRSFGGNGSRQPTSAFAIWFSSAPSSANREIGRNMQKQIISEASSTRWYQKLADMFRHRCRLRLLEELLCIHFPPSLTSL